MSKDVLSNLLDKMYVILSIYHFSINCILVLDNITTLGFNIKNLGYIQLRFVVIVNTFLIININNLCWLVASNHIFGYVVRLVNIILVVAL